MIWCWTKPMMVKITGDSILKLQMEILHSVNFMLHNHQMVKFIMGILLNYLLKPDPRWFSQSSSVIGIWTLYCPIYINITQSSVTQCSKWDCSDEDRIQGYPAYAWQIGTFWQDTLKFRSDFVLTKVISNLTLTGVCYKYFGNKNKSDNGTAKHC